MTEKEKTLLKAFADEVEREAKLIENPYKISGNKQKTEIQRGMKTAEHGFNIGIQEVVFALKDLLKKWGIE